MRMIAAGLPGLSAIPFVKGLSKKYRGELNGRRQWQQCFCSAAADDKGKKYYMPVVTKDENGNIVLKTVGKDSDGNLVLQTTTPSRSIFPGLDELASIPRFKAERSPFSSRGASKNVAAAKKKVIEEHGVAKKKKRLSEKEHDFTGEVKKKILSEEQAFAGPVKKKEVSRKDQEFSDEVKKKKKKQDSSVDVKKMSAAAGVTKIQNLMEEEEEEEEYDSAEEMIPVKKVSKKISEGGEKVKKTTEYERKKKKLALESKSNQQLTAKPKYSKAARRFYNERFRKPERLSKVLAAAGVASRRTCEEIIFAGRITVNGKPCKVPQTPVDPLKDYIYMDGKTLPKKLPPKMVFALYKPKGFICSDHKEEGPKSVLQLFDEFVGTWVKRNPGISAPRFFTVGRLDVATSGLLLVTNDGDFAHQIAHPSSGITKEYVVTVSSKVNKRQFQMITDGTEIDGLRCVPVSVEMIESEAGDSRERLRIVVSDGRNHEVRRIVENARLKVDGLKRVRIGGMRLPHKLRVGKFFLLTESQRRIIVERNEENDNPIAIAAANARIKAAKQKQLAVVA